MAKVTPAQCDIASQAEAEAGTSALKLMTAQRTKQAIEANRILPIVDEDESLSGTAVDFTIPSGVKEFEMYWTDIGTGGSDGGYLGVQLGDSGGVETSGYVGNYSDDQSNSAQMSSIFYVSDYAGTSDVNQAVIRGKLIDEANNKWFLESHFARTNSTHTGESIGHKSLDGELTTIRVTSSNGNPTFDAGEIYLGY